jgi:RNA polymerase sigma factor (TIGR02999 family)
MVAADRQDVTRLLVEWSDGRAEALDALMPLVYDELRRLARAYLGRERAGHTLQPTALVNEAYLRLVDQRSVRWQNRAHFFGIAAQLMRRLLVDHARAANAEKRGGGIPRLELDAAENAVAPESGVDLEELDRALERLARIDPRQSRIVELRYFAGATNEETAEALGIAVATVKRDWTVARAWLRHELQGAS